MATMMKTVAGLVCAIVVSASRHAAYSVVMTASSRARNAP
jgi:hypothetical protein